MKIARALAIKVTLPLAVVGATLLSGAAIAAPPVMASVNSAPVASAAGHACPGHPGMYYGACPKMYYG